ncbi:MAG: hypothetical protein AAGE94_12200 [Acidobacteriota bacterium]
MRTARSVVVVVGGVGVAILAFLLTMRVMPSMDERWQVSSHGSSETIALLVFVTVAMALVAATQVPALFTKRREEAVVFIAIVVGLGVLSTGLLTLLITLRERIDLGVGSLFVLVVAVFWLVERTLTLLPRAIRRIRRSGARRSIDGPR